MSKIAYILLCHQAPEAIIAQAQRLTATGDFVSIHYDKRAPQSTYQEIVDALESNPRVTFAEKRIKCGWGAWSLVEATLSALSSAAKSFPRATHFYLTSGDCMPIKSAEYIHDALDRVDCDYIEGHDFFRSDWIKTGLKEERLIYRFHFNERTQAKLFYASLALQQKLKITRQPPADLQMMIGSQWWCLRRATVEKVLAFCDERPDVMRFFATTWIPDEIFFQTVVRHLVPVSEIQNRTPTFLIFSDYGMPVNFYDDHYDLLLGQNYFFARKISVEALELRQRLGDLYAEEGHEFHLSGEGRRVYSFLTGRGRIGRRFASRFWERDSSIGLEREVLILACKKWHVAKRLAERIHEKTGLPYVGYLFHELDANLPDLGGIETTLEKRHRHRRALIRLLMDNYDTDRIMFCVDTADLELLRDFDSARCEVRILELECEFSEDYLVGHAERLNLIGADAPSETVSRLLPTLRADIEFESRAIRENGFESLSRVRQSDDDASRAAGLIDFLQVPEDDAREILDLHYLFSD
ncbi:DUF5928 domain-containing protein [Palleronia caenipelagi]|uniref:Peptide O-xylosyltransferase n=1 Tax=Palleronia caenipelagi TaxID=2489174 RepID=A0A547Q5R2_9RHOB|nr:DUF5928 domain-containing protein [Palleronia caenipelagi]TRD21724.1 beta-1,6-N-acetylglucosaminyltransferase [Palleronia caenipelagi]